LTTIALPFTEIGVRAIGLAVRERPEGDRPARETFRGALIVRGSAGHAR
jgi:LacI family transcriptional regulator